MSEIDHVAQAIAECHSGRDWAGMSDHGKDWWKDEARAAIAALDAYRSSEKRKNCKHHSRIGTGCLGSDGGGWNTWFCQECGASYDSRSAVGALPPRAPSSQPAESAGAKTGGGK